MNCLSDRKFENLLLVDVTVGGESGTALFDSGAQQTVVSEGFLKRSNGCITEGYVAAGNSNGDSLSLKNGLLRTVMIGECVLTELEVLVIADDMLTAEDNEGHVLQADMLLGYDVIGRFRWSYSSVENTLDIGQPDEAASDGNVYYNEFPTIRVTIGAQSFIAGLDTGHTETVLSSRLKPLLGDMAYTEDVVAGIGSTKKAYVQAVPELVIGFEGTAVVLRDITVQDEIYGAPEEMDLLLGMDLLYGKDWELDPSAGRLRIRQ